VPNPICIHLVRHAEVHNPDEIIYGRLAGFRLSEKGRAQAKAIGEALKDADLSALYSSPMVRAVETAEAIVAFHDGLQITISDLINEVYTPFEGRPISDFTGSNYDFYTESNPPYERPTDILERGREFIQELRQEHARECVAAVTHGDVVAFLLLWATGRPATLDERLVLYKDRVAKGSVTTFTFRTGEPDELPEVEYLPPAEVGEES
jgi:broad specificity phosphatase PhoE